MSSRRLSVWRNLLINQQSHVNSRASAVLNGRLGLAVWAKDPEWEAVHAALQQSRGEASADGMRWAERDFVRELLGTRFDLRFEEGEILLNADSGEAAWNAATGPGGILAAVARNSRAREARGFTLRTSITTSVTGTVIVCPFRGDTCSSSGPCRRDDSAALPDVLVARRARATATQLVRGAFEGGTVYVGTAATHLAAQSWPKHGRNRRWGRRARRDRVP